MTEHGIAIVRICYLWMTCQFRSPISDITGNATITYMFIKVCCWQRNAEWRRRDFKRAAGVWRGWATGAGWGRRQSLWWWCKIQSLPFACPLLSNSTHISNELCAWRNTLVFVAFSIFQFSFRFLFIYRPITISTYLRQNRRSKLIPWSIAFLENFYSLRLLPALYRTQRFKYNSPPVVSIRSQMNPFLTL